MTEILGHFSIKDILKKGKAILRQTGKLPSDCPKKSCLSFECLDLDEKKIQVRFDADPPKLTTTKEWKNYEIHPICESKCSIAGNPNRCFLITQDTTSGEILSTEAAWKGSITF